MLPSPTVQHKHFGEHSCCICFQVELHTFKWWFILKVVKARLVNECIKLACTGTRPNHQKDHTCVFPMWKQWKASATKWKARLSLLIDSCDFLYAWPLHWLHWWALDLLSFLRCSLEAWQGFPENWAGQQICGLAVCHQSSCRSAHWDGTLRCCTASNAYLMPGIVSTLVVSLQMMSYAAVSVKQSNHSHCHEHRGFLRRTFVCNLPWLKSYIASRKSPPHRNALTLAYPGTNAKYTKTLWFASWCTLLSAWKFERLP